MIGTARHGHGNGIKTSMKLTHRDRGGIKRVLCPAICDGGQQISTPLATEIED